MLSLWIVTRQSLLLGGIMFGPWSGLSLCDGDPLSLAAAALELLLSHEEFSQPPPSPGQHRQPAPPFKLCRYFADTVQIMCRYCACVDILCWYCVDTV